MFQDISGRHALTIAPRASLASLSALLLGVGLLVFGTNLQGVLLPILGHERGSGMTAIGLFSAGWSAGFVLACLAVGRVLGRFGHVAAFMMLASVSAGCALLLAAVPHDVAWVVLRVVIGFCYGGLSAIVEGWLVERAGSGVAFSSYMIVNLFASLAGTLSLNLIPGGRAAFVLVAVAILLSTVPVACSRSPRPAVAASFRPRLGRLILASPSGAAGCVVVGLITGAIGGLGPIFGMMSGLSMRGDTFMLAANSVGGALAYAPVGLLAERFDRRLLVIGLALLGIALCVPLALLPDLSPGVLILGFGAFGFAQYPIYGLSVGIATAALPDQAGSETVSELLVLFGLGTIAGPIIAGQVMRTGPQHLFGFIALLLMGLTAVVFAGRLGDRRVVAGLSPDG